VALVGEVLRHVLPSAAWHLRTASGFDLLEPVLIRPSFRTLAPALLVYKEVYEYALEMQEPIYLHDHLQVELATANLAA